MGAAVGVGLGSAAISYGIDKLLNDGAHITLPGIRKQQIGPVSIPVPGLVDYTIIEKMRGNRNQEFTRSVVAGIGGSAITLGISAIPLYKFAPKALLPAAIGALFNLLGWTIIGGIKYATWKFSLPDTKMEFPDKISLPDMKISLPDLKKSNTLGKVIAVDDNNRPTIIVKTTPAGYILYKRTGGRMVPAGLYLTDDSLNNAIDLIILQKNSEEGQRSGMAYTVKPHFVMQSAGMIYRRH